MKYLILLCMASLPIQSKPALSPEVAAYRSRMDHAQDIQDIILDGFASKDAKAIAAQAHELTDLLTQDKQYWQLTKLEPAIRLSEESIRFSERLATDAAEGRLAEAEEDNKNLQKSCRTCHDEHFEKKISN